MKPYKFILSGGGTGGHIYPAIAIANELKARHPQACFLFVGAQDRMEMQKVPKAGYEIEGLWIAGIQRNLSRRNLMFPFKLLHSLARAKKIIKAFNPDVVIGTGGYASAPLLRVASLKKIPCLIQEQNSYAGVANKWLSKKVNTICVAYKGMEKYFPTEKLVLTGNPVREDIIEIASKKEEGQHFFQLRKDKKTLLVLGGSLGAKAINEFIANSLGFFKENEMQVLWQTGSFYFENYKKHHEIFDVQVHDFIYKMDLAYAVADIVISRAGALSVSELSMVGKPVIFIPSPNVAEDHQKKNALAIVQENAAILIEEKNLETQFEKIFTELIHSEEKQKILSQNIKKLAAHNATKAIADEVEKLLQKQ
ncbi:MAG: undecaprenyldiphospho-muramoylpentapeptide beta-N-acetylglucosaminyltransferase [Bacteroidetes bacterium HGW-Bacteroidetes-2]|nr:MAG: undecaprenyldiphospho-muramoylpentapeptide beta-N-acetylglucosaminyltransferase [Bacteroidetes bacterium HGW-Bacteroidetes-2]